MISANKKIILTLCGLSLIALTFASGQCPSFSSVQNCSPKCKYDSDCRSGKCCPNSCNEKSCVQSHVLSNSGTKYNSMNSGATGSYCGNVKCNSFEKCDLKTQKCGRS